MSRGNRLSKEIVNDFTLFSSCGTHLQESLGNGGCGGYVMH